MHDVTDRQLVDAVAKEGVTQRSKLRCACSGRVDRCWSETLTRCLAVMGERLGEQIRSIDEHTENVRPVARMFSVPRLDLKELKLNT